MNSLIFATHKNMRMDLTAQMKDADEIIAAFRVYGIQFDKKFTSLNSNGPSTITFKGIRTDGATARITDMFVDLHARAQAEKIGNVFIKFNGYFTPKANKDKTATETEKETDETSTS